MIVLRGQVLLSLIHALKGWHCLHTCSRSHGHLSVSLGLPLILATHALGLVAGSALRHSLELLTVSLHHLVWFLLGLDCTLDTLYLSTVLVCLIHVLCQILFNVGVHSKLLSPWETSGSRSCSIGLWVNLPTNVRMIVTLRAHGRILLSWVRPWHNLPHQERVSMRQLTLF